MGLDEVVLLKYLIEIECEGDDCMHLAYRRDKWWNVVTTVITL